MPETVRRDDDVRGFIFRVIIRISLRVQDWDVIRDNEFSTGFESILLLLRLFILPFQNKILNCWGLWGDPSSR